MPRVYGPWDFLVCAGVRREWLVWSGVYWYAAASLGIWDLCGVWILRGRQRQNNDYSHPPLLYTYLLHLTLALSLTRISYTQPLP